MRRLQTARRVFAAVPLPEANIAGLTAALVLQRIHPRLLPGPAPIYRGAGAASLLAGGGLATWATVQWRGGDLDHPSRVVTTGPYRFSRHPMYVGWHLIHLGVALSARSMWGLVTLAVAVVAVDHGVRREERELAALLGRDYRDYAVTVPRYGRLLGPN